MLWLAEGAQRYHIEYYIPKTLSQIRDIKHHHHDTVAKGSIEVQISEYECWYNDVEADHTSFIIDEKLTERANL